ncbi:hypothetical protein D9615_000403 [Tricholomella constricta]|uniref:Protein kinase domain-containing protein n=1 Tax=Tricholomella constricta TaxID=117010 RepID=A0A8H5HRM3_9AGAR|nr:hypothetical protein D9615_000403 [Tricholomella constricta]
MSSSFKRVLTDEAREYLVASSTAPQRQVNHHDDDQTFSSQPLCLCSTPDDLAARLRSVGSRVRKNVAEGYTSAPPSFIKSNSTGTIFRSAHDTLREVYCPPAPNSTPVVSPRKTNKRNRPQNDQGYDSDGGVDEDRDAEKGMFDQDSDEDGIDIILGSEAKKLARPMKALRKPRRAMLATRSLPAGEFTVGDNRFNNDATMKRVEEEEDWSSGNLTVQGNNNFAAVKALTRHTVTDITWLPLRPAEVYLGAEWDKTADIWAFGCLIFELVTSKHFFRYQRNAKFGLDETENMLYQMLLHYPRGRPRCPTAGFSEGSRVLRHKLPTEEEPYLFNWSIKARLDELKVVSDEEATESVNLIEQCLRLDPAHRSTAAELLNDCWFSGVE